jgi:DNA-directed RNA polymerase specialized sigma24 family protein
MDSSEDGSPRHTFASGEDPADIAVSALSSERLLVALGGLHEEDRSAIELVDINGASIIEAAAQFGITAREVRSRRERGFAQLQTTLADLAPTSRASVRRS